jgi:hypothetical protein
MKALSPFEGEKFFFFRDLGNGKFHPWDGSQDDMMTPERGGGEDEKPDWRFNRVPS